MDAQSINGGTPLMRAVESSREPVVELLISRGLVAALSDVYLAVFFSFYFHETGRFHETGSRLAYEVNGRKTIVSQNRLEYL